MTSRLLFEALLIELNKVEAPSLLLEDFNYLANKSINLYINKRYNLYDTTQQTTDDLRVLKATVLLEPNRVKNASVSGVVTAFNSLQGATYEVELPTDYLHILNCICIYKVNKTFKCYNKGDYWQHAATRLTSDLWSQVINNWYMRPTYRRPYYFINNVNPAVNGLFSSASIPTNPWNEHEDWKDAGLGTGTDASYVTIGDLFREFKDGFAVREFEEGPNGVLKIKIYGVDKFVVWRKDQNKFDLVDADILDGVAIPSVTEGTLYVKNGTKIGVNNTTMEILDEETKAKTIYVDKPFIVEQETTKVLRLLPKYLDLGNNNGTIDLVEKPGGHRYGNASSVRLEVRYGN